MKIDIPEELVHWVEQVYYFLRNDDKVKSAPEHEDRLKRIDMLTNYISDQVFSLIRKESLERKKLLK